MIHPSDPRYSTEGSLWLHVGYRGLLGQEGTHLASGTLPEKQAAGLGD